MAESITRKNIDLDILDYYDGKIKNYVDNKVGTGSLTIDDTLSDTSTNPVQNKVVKQAIDNKADKSLYGDTTINVGRKAGTTVGKYSTAEGRNITASSWASHAEGEGTTASSDYSHAEGKSTAASGLYSHAEGRGTTASGAGSHAEGSMTTASGGFSSHAEGDNTTASGDCSHAEGSHTTASGANSHAGGIGTKALHDNEAAYGKYNKSNDDTIFSIGDGTADDARHNAFEITTTGGKLHDKDIATTDLIPTSLPASGGNADTLDGKHASEFVSYNIYAPIYKGDLLDITEMGTYSCQANEVTNVPSAIPSWCYVTMTRFRDAGYRRYICSPINMIRNDTYNILYTACESYKDSDGKLIWQRVNDGGNADTVDGKHAGDFAASINPTIIGSIKIMGYSTNTVQSIFSDGDIIRIRNLDSETSQANNYADIVVTTSGVFTEKAVNGVWQGRKELLTSTCVTGTSTIVDSNNFVSANFGFTPSAVLYAVYDSKTGIDDNYRLALNFNSDGFITQSRTAPPIGGGIETFSYIAFR